MNILIMGGSYFIGWHLVQQLARNAHKIWVFNRGTKHRDYLPNVQHIHGDRNDFTSLRGTFSELPVDVVYDLTSFRGEQTAVMLNVFKRRIKQFIHVSTAAVYLQSEIFPIKETSPKGRHHIWGEYGENKLDCENFLMDRFLNDAFPVTIVRPSYVYGPENYIPRERFLYERIFLSRTIVVPGDGNALIQLGHVFDLIRAFLLILDNSKAIGQIYNVSGEEYITLNGLVQLVGQIMEREVDVLHVNTGNFGLKDRDVFPFDNCTYFTDIQKAKRELAFVPEYTLRKGLVEGYELWLAEKAEIAPSDFSKEDKVIAALGHNRR